MRRFVQEPLVHFILLGAALFVLYGLVRRPGSGAANQIIITAGQIEHLEIGFEKTWQRPPSDAELKGLIDDWVREEIATREALALGLDKDDTVIRRRLRQKLEFVSDDIAARTEPTDADLTAYLQAHPNAFRVEPRITFSQVFLNPEKHGQDLARDAAQLLSRLSPAGGKADVSKLGDPFLLEHEFTDVPASEIAKQFGEPFAAELGKLSPGRWQGPIESGYGEHLVYISGHAAGHLPALSEVHDAVLREWTNARRQQANTDFYRELSKRYTVTIEAADTHKGPKALARATK